MLLWVASFLFGLDKEQLNFILGLGGNQFAKEFIYT